MIFGNHAASVAAASLTLLKCAGAEAELRLRLRQWGQCWGLHGGCGIGQWGQCLRLRGGAASARIDQQRVQMLLLLHALRESVAAWLEAVGRAGRTGRVDGLHRHSTAAERRGEDEPGERCAGEGACYVLPFLKKWYPSAGGRLFGIGGMIEGWGFRFRRVMGSVHKLDYGHKFAGAGSAPVVARGAEAGDCCGLAGAGVIGIGGGTALRRECEPGFCVAQALSRTGQHRGSSATGAGDGDAGSAVRALTGVDERVDRN